MAKATITLRDAVDQRGIKTGGVLVTHSVYLNGRGIDDLNPCEYSTLRMIQWLEQENEEQEALDKSLPH